MVLDEMVITYFHMDSGLNAMLDHRILGTNKRPRFTKNSLQAFRQ